MAERTLPPEPAHKLLVHFDVHHCELSQDALDQMTADLDTLERSAANFPQRDLRVLIEFQHHNSVYAVKVSLLLPGKTLVCSDLDPVLHAAYERCLRSLQHGLDAYKHQLGQVSERQKSEKGTHHDLLPLTPIDGTEADAAVAAGDYAAFRAAVEPYADGLRLRAGRWVERYPAVQARMGRGLDVGDIVEGVFLAAFEEHAGRAAEVRYGDWLDGLIDPTVRHLAGHPDDDLENIRMAATAAAIGRA